MEDVTAHPTMNGNVNTCNRCKLPCKVIVAPEEQVGEYDELAPLTEKMVPISNCCGIEAYDIGLSKYACSKCGKPCEVTSYLMPYAVIELSKFELTKIINLLGYYYGTTDVPILGAKLKEAFAYVSEATNLTTNNNEKQKRDNKG